MLWFLLTVAVVVVLAIPLVRRQRRRAWEELTRAGLTARRTQPPRGVGALGEAPPAVHHRMGGPSSRD